MVFVSFRKVSGVGCGQGPLIRSRRRPQGPSSPNYFLAGQVCGLAWAHESPGAQVPVKDERGDGGNLACGAEKHCSVAEGHHHGHEV